MFQIHSTATNNKTKLLFLLLALMFIFISDQSLANTNFILNSNPVLHFKISDPKPRNLFHPSYESVENNEVFDTPYNEPDDGVEYQHPKDESMTHQDVRSILRKNIKTAMMNPEETEGTPGDTERKGGAQTNNQVPPPSNNQHTSNDQISSGAGGGDEERPPGGPGNRNNAYDSGDEESEGEEESDGEDIDDEAEFMTKEDESVYSGPLV